MSDKPRVGTMMHAIRYPNKASVCNLNYTYGGRKVSNFLDPWLVCGGSQIDEKRFATHTAALEYAIEQVAA